VVAVAAGIATGASAAASAGGSIEILVKGESGGLINVQDAFSVGQHYCGVSRGAVAREVFGNGRLRCLTPDAVETFYLAASTRHALSRWGSRTETCPVIHCRPGDAFAARGLVDAVISRRRRLVVPVRMPGTRAVLTNSKPPHRDPASPAPVRCYRLREAAGGPGGRAGPICPSRTRPVRFGHDREHRQYEHR
jgi:hypothetical protein